MKKKYTFHPNNYAIGDTEKYYSDMAADGWILDRRGLFISRFKKSESSKLRYRVEIMEPDVCEIENCTDEQIIMYEECGWKYISGLNNIHIFCAPEDCDVPEIYSNPKHQAPVIKSFRNYHIWGLLSFFIIIVLNLDIIDMIRHPQLAEIMFSTIDSIIIYTLLYLFSLCLLTNQTIGIIKLNRLYKDLKNGIPLDHSPKSKKFPSQVIPIFLFIIVLFIGIFYIHI